MAARSVKGIRGCLADVGWGRLMISSYAPLTPYAPQFYYYGRRR